MLSQTWKLFLLGLVFFVLLPPLSCLFLLSHALSRGASHIDSCFNNRFLFFKSASENDTTFRPVSTSKNRPRPTSDRSPQPERALLKCFPSQLQATRVMAVLDIRSTHSPDEEYIGEKMEPSWAEDPVIKAAFERFREKLKKLEALIDERNENAELKNRNGADIVPYELLKPFSKPGVTGMGFPVVYLFKLQVSLEWGSL
ncbi:hypothetical protein Fmac_009608 [Flemingia macrophylla]|uniref:Lipoxygenase domain-containing protein n=1 Tax=Flemingia macrophylla TaxID=520843 RepID=A0ABD1N0Q4_9FABA